MPKYLQGQIVRKRSDRSITGTVAQVVSGLILNQQFYVIDIGNRRIRMREDEIEATTTSADPRDQFLDRSFGHPEQALLGLTFHRLNANLSNYIYSFNGSRTDFMPHQFKPLIKFLDSPSRRILIADEVGLGKTIEAGIILLEMQARQELRGAMIVCPANLCDKWRMEMLDRFELEFTVMTGSGLAECLRAPDAAYRSLMLITSYESLRSDKCIDAVAALENPFNIVIADEAHRVRNPYSKTHEAMLSLSGRSDALLLLTATPVNNRSEDLLSLLKLLDDSVFANDTLYNRQILLNSIILEVERRLRIEPIDYPSIRDLLNRFRTETAASWSVQSAVTVDDNPYFSQLNAAVAQETIASLDDRVSAQRCAAKLNLLADYINRTRRSEVQEFKPVREPNVFLVEFSEAEADLYELVKSAAMRYFDQFRLPVMTFERMASSCLPAFIERFRGSSVANHTEDEEDARDALGSDTLSDATGSEDDEASSFQEVAAKLLSKFSPAEYERIDSKFAKLKETLESIQRQEHQAKVIIFSFFRGTLRYLSRRLAEIGISHVSIHGGVSNQEDGQGGSPRRRLYAQFRNDPSIRVMLSSEVGSEGLDFQFSNVVVNYDLPWNPMVIEQRIGRIDRIGQEREKLHIYAFVIQNSIDQLIHQHLLAKIDVFKQCVGDLEAIVGSSLSEFADIAYRRELSEAQRREQMDQKASAILHRKQMMDSLDEEASKSGSLHDYIRDELQRIRSGGRWLSEQEMSDLVHRLLERNELELVIRPGFIEGVQTARTTGRAQGFFEAHAGADRSRELMRFQHDLRQDKLQWTFNQHIAFKHPTVHLFNARHPAIRILLRYYTQKHHEGAVFPSVGSFRFPRGDADVAPGCYILGQFHASFEGPVRRKEMLSVALRIDPDAPGYLRPQQAGRILGRLTSRPPGLGEAQLPDFDRSTWADLIDQLSNLATEEIARRQSELEADQHEHRGRRRMQLEAQRDKDLRNAKVRIDGLRQQARISGKNRSDGLIQYWTAKLERFETTYREQLARLDHVDPITHEEENMFLAYCEVI